MSSTRWQHAQGHTEFRIRAETQNNLQAAFPQIFLRRDGPDTKNVPQFSSVQFSRSVVSDSLWPHESQHSRPPCPSPTPGVYSHSCPLSWGCHPTLSSSVVPFSSCLQSFPAASESFQMSHFFPSGGQSIWVSASASVLPMNIQDWLPSGWNDWIFLQSQESSLTPQFKSINSLVLSFLYGPTLTSIHDLLEKQQLWLDGPLLAV